MALQLHGGTPIMPLLLIGLTYEGVEGESRGEMILLTMTLQ